MNAEQAWQAALGQLQMEMPKATFDTWVRGAELVSYDQASGVFVIGAPNEFSREWLEGRLQSTVKRLLTGIMNRTVEVQFVIYQASASISEVRDVTEIKAEQAWQAALAQLQMEMPKATFDTWVRDIELVSYEDDTFILGVANAYARDWLEGRLQSTVTRLLTGIMNRELSVRFIVWQGNEEAPDEEIEDSAADEDQELQWMIEAIPASVREAITRSWRIISIDAYYLRWLPYLGYHLWWLGVAFFQMLFFETGRDNGAGRENTIFKASLNQLAKWSGSSRRSVIDLLNKKENQRKLRSFFHQLGASMKDGEREMISYTDSTGMTHQIQAGNRFLLVKNMPLTPGDAAHLRRLLQEAGIQADPLTALGKAVDLPRSALLPDLQPCLAPEDHTEPPAPVSTLDVVEMSYGHTIPKDIRSDFYDMAERLSKRIMPDKDRIMISWYFVQNWLPQNKDTLSHGPAAAIILLKDKWHYLHQISEMQASDKECRISDLFDGIWLKHGYDDIASWMGVEHVTVRRWFTSMQAASRPGKREVMDRFIKIERRRNTKAPKQPVQWLLTSDLLDPLRPDDQQLYEYLLDLYDAIREAINNLETQPTLETVAELPISVNEFIQALQQGLYRNQALPGNILDAWEEFADALVSILHYPPEISVSRLPHPPFLSVSILPHPSDNPVSESHYPLAEPVSEIHHLPNIPVSKLRQLKHLVLNIIYTAVTAHNPKARRDKNRTTATPKPPDLNAKSSDEWVGGLSDSWNWEFLLPASGIKSRKLRDAVQKIQPWIWVAHLLYGYSPAGLGIDDVIAVALEGIKTEPEIGRGGNFDLLAHLPPLILQDMIRQAIAQGGNPIGISSWDDVMKNSTPARLLELAVKLNLVK